MKKQNTHVTYSIHGQIQGFQIDQLIENSARERWNAIIVQNQSTKIL